MEELVNTTIRDAAWDAMMATPECGTQLPEDAEGPEAREEARAAAALQQVHTMKRRRDQVPLFDAKVFERKARQTEIVDPALTRVKAAGELDRQGLDRMTWRDHVEFGAVETPIGRQPSWKHRFDKGAVLTLTPKRDGDPPVTAVVLFSTSFPVDERLPLSVQVRVAIHGRDVDMTCLPTTAIQSVLGRCGA